MDITLEELKNMTDDEVRNLNRTLGKKVMKKFLIQFAAATALTLTAIAIANRFQNDSTETEDN